MSQAEEDSPPLASPAPGKRECYLPIAKAELIDLLCAQDGLPDGESHAFRRLCGLLAATFHFEFHRELETLKQAYAPFDPDRDTRLLTRLSQEETQQQVQELFEKFIWLLGRANFQALSRPEIERALSEMSEWGVNLELDFNIFDRLEVFARGDAIGRRWRRRWRKWLKLEEVEVPIYQRLVVMFKLAKAPAVSRDIDTKTVYIKLFKDIPHLDLEMLLPGTRVRMSLTDRMKIFLPTASGLAISIWKIAEGELLLAAAGFYGVLAFIGLVGGTVGYGVRSYFGYLNTKQKYQLNLTQSLYYQNLDNNAGVLFRLLDEGEEQECREALLGYYFLWREAGDEGWPQEQLDRRIEEFLAAKVGCDVDFEIHDALHKLERLGLVERRADGRLRAVPLETGLETLDRAWDSFFEYHAPASAAV